VVTWRTCRWLALLALLASGAWLFLRDNRTVQVRKTFHRLAGIIAKESGESPLLTAAKAERLGRLFAPECSLELPEEELTGTFAPEQLSALMVRSRAQFRSVALAFPDLVVSFPEDNLAAAAATARIQIIAQDGRVVLDETRELECELVRTEGDWRFRQIRVIQVLQR